MKVIRKNMVALVVFLISLVLLVFNTHPIPHHGQSSFLLAQKLGIDPLPMFLNPIYGWVVHVISVISGSAVIHAVNLFSAVCGAGVLALVFLFIYRFVRVYNTEKSFAPPAMHRVQLFCGVLGVLYLLASAPFVQAATRANPLTFDLLLLMVPFYLAISSSKDNYGLRLPLASLLYGIAIVEFNTAILMAPVFGILILVRLWLAGAFATKEIAKIFGAGLAGLSLYLIQAGLYSATPAYVWREFDSYFKVLWYIWAEQYNGLTGSLPRVGWLTVGLVSFLPWLITSTMRLTRKTANNRGATFGVGSLHLMLGVLAVLLLVKNFPLAPATVTGMHRLFVTPYIIIAIWVAGVAAFWLVQLFGERRFEAAVIRKIRRGLGYALVVAAPAYTAGVAFSSALPATYSADDKLAYAFAQEVVDMAEDKVWLVTKTPFDDQLALEAYRRGLPLKVLRLSYGQSVAYMRYVATLFADSPRLQSLAGVGLAPLMDEWFISDPDIDRKACVVHVPDIWLMAGMEAVPDRLVFNGVKAGADQDLDEIFSRNQAFWEEFGARLPARDDGRSLSPVESWTRVHMSKVANNLGVYLEDKGRERDALACYEQARAFAPDNLSALMNLHVLTGKLELPEHADYEKELVERTRSLMGRVQTWTLSYVYGFVRVPELFVNRGMAFAMSGKANMAITDMKRALALKEDDPDVQMALAELYFSQDKDDESSEYYRSVLESSPDNARAMLGLMRTAIRQGDIEEARLHLRRLKELKYNPDALALEEAVLEAFSGSPEKSMSLLKDLVKRKPDNMKAWAAVAVTAAKLNDVEAGEEAIRRLRDAKVLSPNIQIVMAQSALDQQDRDGARMYLNEILSQQPGNIRALEMLLRISMSEGNEDAVKDAVDELLAHDPSNAMGNYMLGAHHFYNEEYELAESAYRASLASRKLPVTMNDLAYVLYVQGELDEAEVLIKESLAIGGPNPSSLDTLGVILTEQGKFKEAEDAIVESLSLRPEARTVMLSLALLYEKQQRWEEARELVYEISTHVNELPPIDQGKLASLQQRLDDRR